MLGIQLALGGYEDRFAARIDAIRLAGEPLHFSDLATPPVPDEQNAAKLWEEAATWLGAHSQAYGWTLWDLNGDERAERDEQDCLAYLESLEPYYERLKRIPERSGWSVPIHDPDSRDGRAAERFSWLSEASTYLRYRVELDPRDEGRTERAAEAALLMLDLVDHWQEPTLIGYYVRMSVQSSAVLILRTVHAKSGFDARLYRKLVEQRLAAAAPEKGPPAHVLRQARVHGMWMVRKWLRGELVTKRRPGWMERLRTTWVGRPWVFRDAVRYLDVIDAAIMRCDKAPEEAVRVARALEQESDYDHDSLAGRFQRFLPNLFSHYAATVAQNRCARVVMALLEHKQETGEWPETTPADLPHNPYTNAPFEYERRGDGIRIEIPEIQEEWVLAGS